MSNPTIFVSIIAYRDPEVQWTIEELYERATNPKRVFCGVVVQYDPAKDTDMLEFDFTRSAKTHGQVRALWMKHTDARGPCYARHLAQTLFVNEDFYLQLDCHMRFVDGWDDLLLTFIGRCEALSSHSRVALSAYPPDFERGTRGAPPVDNADGGDKGPTVLCCSSFGDDGFPRFMGRVLRKQPTDPVRTHFLAAGFLFCSSRLIAEVPYDPHLKCLFFGEEISLAVRMFTHGWDVFCPPRTIVYHSWDRSTRPSFWEIFDEHRKAEQKESQERVRSLLRMHPPPASTDTVDSERHEDSNILPPYGLGATRTLESFCDESGVDLTKRTLTEKAKYSGLHRGDFFQTEADLLNILQLVAANS